MTLTERQPVSRNTVRLTFTAPHFIDFEPLGPDEFFGLVIPAPGAGLPRLPPPDVDLRQFVLAIPEALRPAVRWYTVRAHRPSVAEIDVDVVLHGETGPASTWATHASPGDRVGFRESAAPYLAPEDGHQLLIADETAVPALAAILEAADGPLDATVLAEVPGPADVVPIATPTPVRWLFRDTADPGTLVLPALPAAVGDVLPRLGYAWLCGESAIVTGARRWLVDAGVDPALIMFSGYWRIGRARE